LGKGFNWLAHSAQGQNTERVLYARPEQPNFRACLGRKQHAQQLKEDRQSNERTAHLAMEVAEVHNIMVDQAQSAWT